MSHTDTPASAADAVQTSEEILTRLSDFAKRDDLTAEMRDMAQSLTQLVKAQSEEIERLRNGNRYFQLEGIARQRAAEAEAKLAALEKGMSDALDEQQRPAAYVRTADLAYLKNRKGVQVPSP